MKLNKIINFFKKYIIKILLIILIIISIIQIINWFNDNKKTSEVVSLYENLIEVNKNENNENIILVDFEGLTKINEDVVAYVKVNNTNISYPVVKANNNEYYLTRSLDKNYNDAGWIFADYKNNFDGEDKNIILYGHSRLDESMFGSINDMLKKDWYENIDNLLIDFLTLEGSYKYEIFSMYYIDDEEYYLTTDFTDNSYEKFLDTLVKRSIVDFNLDINITDKILTLSTCGATDDDRIVVHARLVNYS